MNSLRRATLNSLVAEETASGGRVRLLALPAPGEDPMTAVRETLRQGDIAVEEIYQERGRLEDVFRGLTVDGAR